MVWVTGVIIIASSLVTEPVDGENVLLEVVGSAFTIDIFDQWELALDNAPVVTSIATEGGSHSGSNANLVIRPVFVVDVERDKLGGAIRDNATVAKLEHTVGSTSAETILVETVVSVTVTPAIFAWWVHSS